MKQTVRLEGDWWLRQAVQNDLVSPGLLNPSVYTENPSIDAGWYDSKKALSVHEILLEHKALDERIKIGDCESCVWVAESDWLYCKDFCVPEKSDGPVRLLFKGLDTVVDIFINDCYVAHHEDMFLPSNIDITDHLKTDNRLLLYFHSPYKIIKQLKVPSEWEGYINPSQLLRKSHLDYAAYLGVHPYLTPIGIFEDVFLEYCRKAYISYTDINTRFDATFSNACITVATELEGDITDCELKVSVFDPDGKPAAGSEPFTTAGHVCSSKELVIECPRLWWPRPYGGQPLYTVKVELLNNGVVIDISIKQIGLRKIEKTGDMRFTVNGTEIKMWGSNFVPPYCISHRWQPERGLAALEMAKAANMNILRIWGEGVPYGDELYDFADREGILLWHDFFVWYGHWPDSEQFRAIHRVEAEYLVKRLKHRPSILLWCGGNESYMYIRSDKAKGRQFGYTIYAYDLAEVSRRLDPDRCYIASSPSGGSYPNDALGGDTHYYNGAEYVAGIRYPVFVTENCYTTALSKKSMLCFMTAEEIFPESYSNTLNYGANNPFFELTKDRVSFRYWRPLPIPETWWKHLDEYAHCELWGIERYYDAHDLDSMLHRFSAPAADYYKHVIERQRCGRPACDVTGTRRTQGHLTWKLNDAFPSINFTLVDAFLEPTAAYYAVKRAYSPVLLSIEVEDHIYLWGVNDTKKDIEGRLYFKLFSRYENKVTVQFDLPVFLRAGESKVFTDLDRLGSVCRECIMHVELRDESGKTIACNSDVFENERDITFPDARISMTMENYELIITTDQYAHYVELNGNEDGDEFGWYFDDNYFELLPFETKHVKVGGRHKKGRISAKPFFSSNTSHVDF